MDPHDFDSLLPSGDEPGDGDEFIDPADIKAERVAAHAFGLTAAARTYEIVAGEMFADPDAEDEEAEDCLKEADHLYVEAAAYIAMYGFGEDHRMHKMMGMPWLGHRGTH